MYLSQYVKSHLQNQHLIARRKPGHCANLQGAAVAPKAQDGRVMVDDTAQTGQRRLGGGQIP